MNTLRLNADYESARALGPWLLQSLESIESPQRDRVGELELAIHEVAINIVDHAFGADAAGREYTVSLDGNATTGEVTVRLCDDGEPFVAAPTPDLDKPQVGGYGLFIAEQLTSSLSYERSDEQNIWTLIFAAEGTPHTQPQETKP